MSEVSIPSNPIKDVVDDILIALRKGKRLSSILFLNLCVLIITLNNIRTYEIDYEETLALVTKMNTIRVFLHGDLVEVYIEILPRFYSHNEKNKVCTLIKTLYRLKQSPRAWFGRFAQVMISLEYRQSQETRYLYLPKEVCT
ncbi:hypothetical protein CR513_60909, partial [Mucuna pruriens]